MPDDPREGAPADVREDIMPVARVDALVCELETLLDRPGHPAHASVRLRQCDRIFGEIDAHLRAGGPPPSTWQVDPDAGVPAREYATARYDALSETLRERGGVALARRALTDARKAWEALDAALREGSPLPDPWRAE